LNPPHACLAIFQSRALCSKVDPSCCQLKADVDAGPHLLSSGPSANARRWIPPRVHSSRPERSRLDLMGGRRRGAGGGPRRSPRTQGRAFSPPLSAAHTDSWMGASSAGRRRRHRRHRREAYRMDRVDRPGISHLVEAKATALRTPETMIRVRVRFKIGRSAVRPRPWPPTSPQVRPPLTCGYVVPGSAGATRRLTVDDR
jgi:hypothetical protein